MTLRTGNNAGVEPDATLRIARVYDRPGPEDGSRILVDRLWPRGLSKQSAALDDWCREVAPSTELRQWYSHDPAKTEEFELRYRAELELPEPAAALVRLRALCAQGAATLLTASKSLEISHAAVLARVVPDCSASRAREPT
jgi:uncharacterized protein YeaO (DUF488 family)